MKKLQRKIIDDTEHLRPLPKYPTYPPYHVGYYIEDYFFNYYLKNNVETDRIYLPIFWTSCYNNTWYDNNIVMPDIQSFLNTLDPNLKYFTVCQHERAPQEKLPNNTLIFSSSGKIHADNKSNNHVPIPLVCSPIKNIKLNKKRDIFCSFIGANTHKIRKDMFNALKSEDRYYLSLNEWNIDTPKPKEDEFKNITERSVFALSPRGDGPTSFRTYEAMQLGAIPVYIYDYKWIPYENKINWNDLCIFIHENEIPHLKDILEHIPEDKIEKMRLEIKRVYNDFFTLQSVSKNIISHLKEEKMRLITFYTESHKELIENYFLPTIEKFNEFDVKIENFDQNCEGYYRCDGWGDAMLNKVNLIIRTIKETWGDYFVYSDCDIMFFDKIKDQLLKSIRNHDISFQHDGNSVCAGFFICKSNENTLKLWETVKENTYKFNDDQLTLNQYLDIINYNRLPISFFTIGNVNGFKRWDGEKSYSIPKNIVMFHANWTIGVNRKIELFNYIIDNMKHKIDLSDMKIEYFNKKTVHNFNNGKVLIGDLVDGNITNPIYLNINIISDIVFNEKGINVFYNYYDVKNKDRKKELKYCLDMLLSNKKISNLYILCSNKLDIEQNNVTKIDFNFEQPSFKDYFNIINFYSSDESINILLNSDCFVDEKNIDLISKNIKENEVYCLSRWDIVSNKDFKSTHYDIECSQDAWIKIGKFSNRIEGNYKMGVPGCDNAIAYEFQKIGYKISNPSKDIKIYHYHLSDVRTYGVSHDDKESHRIRRPYVFVQSSKLDENTITKKIISDDVTEKKENFNSSTLNKFVDNVYLINLKRRDDRLNHMINEFDKINVSFKRFNAIDGKIMGDGLKSSQVACLRSHVGVIRDALRMGYNRFVIFEDDVIFCDDFEKRFKYYSENVPDDWDIMYLGCNLHSSSNPKFIKNFIYKVEECYGCFAMILNNKNGLFEKIIEITKDEEKPIDNYYHEQILKEFKAYVFAPFFVKTLNTISDISDNKNKFSYEEVDKYFKNEVDLTIFSKIPIFPKTFPTPPPPKPQIDYVKSNQDICEDFVKGNLPFQIFHNNRLIFDSDSSDKMNLRFFRDSFTLYGRQFNYQGMLIKRK